jgi:hypothetical protein
MLNLVVRRETARLLKVNLCAINVFHTYVGYFEPTALRWLKIRRNAEVPEQDKHLSLLSIYGEDGRGAADGLEM